MALTAIERETVIVWSDADDRILVTTSQRKVITQILANPQAEILSDKMFDGSRMIEATLPLGGVTLRKKAAGTIKRNGGTKTRSMPANAARCGFVKEDGKPCQSLASKEHGKCHKHKGK